MEEKKGRLKPHIDYNFLNRLRRFVFSRVFVMSLAIVAELLLLLLLVDYVSRWLLPVYIAMYVLGIVVIIYLINKQGNPSSRQAWIIICAAFPIFGLILFLLFGIERVPHKFRRDQLASISKYKPLLVQTEKDLDDIRSQDEAAYRQARYIWDYSYFPIHGHTSVEYFSSGEAFYKQLLRQLRAATKFIYIETFIIKEGAMFSSILDVLKEKAAQGVVVRFMYDDVGTAMYLPTHYERKLEKLGIKCRPFNPMRPILLVTMNNRDHRKVIIVDGKVGFTGGLNLADEYVNIDSPFGHWKDAGVMIEGEAVGNMEIMFLQLWQSGLDDVLPQIGAAVAPAVALPTEGYVQPFSDSPTDNEDISHSAHLNMIWSAQRFIWMMTPYLVVSDDIIQALSQAAKNGVDVRIITPHIPDKKIVFELTRSFYPALLSAGVKVYEYTPGFIHSKVMLADGRMAIVGSINMDNRSYYTNFEDGVFMYEVPALKEIQADFKQTFAISQAMVLSDCIKVPWWRKAIRAVLRLAAPML